MCVPQNYTTKEMSKGDKAQLSSTVINQIQAKNLKDGMWAIHSVSGYSGKVQGLKKIKDGKHGHCKVVYELRLPHNNGIKVESFKGKKGVKQAYVEKVDYLVSYYDEDTASISCFDDDMKQIDLNIANDKVDALLKTMELADKEGKDCYVTVLEVPMVSMKNEEDVEILQIVSDAKAVDPNWINEQNPQQKQIKKVYAVNNKIAAFHNQNKSQN